MKTLENSNEFYLMAKHYLTKENTQNIAILPWKQTKMQNMDVNFIGLVLCTYLSHYIEQHMKLAETMQAKICSTWSSYSHSNTMNASDTEWKTLNFSNKSFSFIFHRSNRFHWKAWWHRVELQLHWPDAPNKCIEIIMFFQVEFFMMNQS